MKQSARRQLFSMLLLCGLLVPTGAPAQPDDPDLDGIPGEAPAPAEPFAAAPSILVGTGRLLIDRSHANDFDVSGFTDFLVSQGWVVSEHESGPVTGSVLAGHDVFLVPSRGQSTSIFPYTAAEIAAIQGFLGQDNGMWVLADNVNPEGVNSIASVFGVVFQYDFIQDPTNNEGQLFWPTVYDLASHPITAGVESYGYYSGPCIAVSSPAEIVGRADDDAYSLSCPVGSRPPTLATWESGGRVVFAGDQTPLHPTYYPERLRPEEQLLLQNIANWLLGEVPTSVEAVSWGSVKAAFAPARTDRMEMPAP